MFLIFVCYVLAYYSSFSYGNNAPITSTYDKAFEYSLKIEGGLTQHKYDVGGITKFGISLAFLKAEKVDINLDGIVNREDVILLDRNHAHRLYKKYFWNKLKLDLIHDKELATRIFDSAINIGSTTVVLLIQKTLFCFGDEHEEDLKLDGIMGPKTIYSINHINRQSMFKNVLVSSLKYHYVNLCNKNPKLRVFFCGWIKRISR